MPSQKSAAPISRIRSPSAYASSVAVWRRAASVAAILAASG